MLRRVPSSTNLPVSTTAGGARVLRPQGSTPPNLQSPGQMGSSPQPLQHATTPFGARVLRPSPMMDYPSPSTPLQVVPGFLMPSEYRYAQSPQMVQHPNLQYTGPPKQGSHNHQQNNQHLRSTTTSSHRRHAEQHRTHGVEVIASACHHLVVKIRRLVQEELVHNPKRKQLSDSNSNLLLLNESGEELKGESEAERILRVMRKVEELYKQLESRARHLSSSHVQAAISNKETHRKFFDEIMDPMSESLERTLFTSELLDEFQKVKWTDPFTNLLPSSDVLPYFAQCKLRRTCLGKSLSATDTRRIIVEKEHKAMMANLNVLNVFNNSVLRTTTGMESSILHSDQFSIVFQLDLSMSRSRSGEHPIDPHMRAVLVCHGGVLQALRMGSPRETLYRDAQLLDSSLEVYREITIGVQNYLSHSRLSQWYTHHQPIHWCLSILRNYMHCFTLKCAGCRRVMIDFLPPTRIVSIAPPQFRHENCYDRSC